MKTPDKNPKKAVRKQSFPNEISSSVFTEPINRSKLEGEIFKQIDSIQSKLRGIDKQLREDNKKKLFKRYSR